MSARSRMSRPACCRRCRRRADRHVEAFRAGGRRIIPVPPADAQYERLSPTERSLFQRAIEMLLREPGHVRLYAGRSDTGGRPGEWLLLMQPLLIGMREAGGDIEITMLLFVRDPAAEPR